MFNKKNSRFFLLLFFPVIAFAGSGKMRSDSLERVLKVSKQDTTRVKILIALAKDYRTVDLVKADSSAQEAFRLSMNLGYISGQAESYNVLGLIYRNKGDLAKALEYYMLAMPLTKRLGNESQTAKVHGNIARIYMNQGKYPPAIENLLLAIATFEKLKDNKSLAAAEGSMGILYSRMGKSKEAIEYYRKAIALRTGLNDEVGIANDLENLGIEFGFIYKESKKQADFDTAMSYHHRSLAMSLVQDDKQGVAMILNNMARVELSNVMLEGNKEAIARTEKTIERALKMNQEVGDKSGIASCLMNLGTLYARTGDYEKSIKLREEALVLIKEIGQIEWLRDTYHAMAQVQEDKKDYKGALGSFRNYSNWKDSLLNETSNKQVAELKEKFEADKKEKQLEILRQRSEIDRLDIDRQKNIRNSTFAVMALVLILVFVLYNRYLLKKRSAQTLMAQNILIEEKNTNLEIANAIIEEKNTDITDSINYAKRIQEAILPPKELKYQLFPEAFVLFKPRDIVSGDFYWFAERDGKKIIAAVDCTGHGVPGAFMSMIGNTFLNDIVNKQGITQPSEILNHLRTSVISSLKQDEGENKDGMDIAICCFNSTSNSVEYAGAHNPLWIVRNEELIEFKADKLPLNFNKGQAESFTNHHIEIQKGDNLYIFTDGYQDQFGGDKGKKFRSKQLQELLVSISKLSMADQEKKLNDILEAWQGNYEQVDDILVIGIKV